MNGSQSPELTLTLQAGPATGHRPLRGFQVVAVPDPDWARVVVYSADLDGVHRSLELAYGADLVVKASGVGSSGMWITGHPAHEVYLCEPNPESPNCVRAWNREEYLSATGTGNRTKDVEE